MFYKSVAQIVHVELAHGVGIFLGLGMIALFQELERHLREQGVGKHVLLRLGDALGLFAIFGHLGLNQIGGTAGNDFGIADALFANVLIDLAGQTAILAAQQTLGLLGDHLVALAAQHVQARRNTYPRRWPA